MSGTQSTRTLWGDRPRSIASNGLAIYQSDPKSGTDSRQAPALLLIHGVGLRAESWNALIPTLSNAYTVYAVDMPGHGHSLSIADPAPHLNTYSDPIANILKGLDTPAIVCGHSMGAMIALDLADRYPDHVSKCIAMNAIFERSSEAARAMKLRAEALTRNTTEPIKTAGTIERWFGAAPTGDAAQAAHACTQWLLDTRRADYARAYGVFAHENGSDPEALKKLTQPTLFLTGEYEPNSKPAMSLAMAALAPKGQAHIIKGGAHMMMMTHPQAVIDALMAFLGP